VLRFDFAAGEEKKVIAAVDAYRLSADGEQLTYMQNGKAGIVSARGDNAKGTTLNHSDLKPGLHRAPNGNNSSTKPGACSATITTNPVCTASIGQPNASAISH
jgi:hypothetical protein